MLVARTPNVRQVSQNFWTVSVDYAPLEIVERETDEPNKLDSRPKYRWQIGLKSEPVDRDIEGNPILNSAGQAFEQPAQRDFPTINLVVSRYEPFFNIALCLEYTNTTNADRWRVPGTNGSVDPGQARCVGIQPAEEYPLGIDYVLMQYAFEFQADGFDLRLRDQGTRGATARGTAAILDTNGDEVTSDVLLDGRGLPLNDTYTLKGGQSFGILSPVRGAEVERTESAVFLRYRNIRRAVFGRLELA